jgi:hypothetical protein
MLCGFMFQDVFPTEKPVIGLDQRSADFCANNRAVVSVFGASERRIKHFTERSSVEGTREAICPREMRR